MLVVQVHLKGMFCGVPVSYTYTFIHLLLVPEKTYKPKSGMGKQFAIDHLNYQAPAKQLIFHWLQSIHIYQEKIYW